MLAATSLPRFGKAGLILETERDGGQALRADWPV